MFTFKAILIASSLVLNAAFTHIFQGGNVIVEINEVVFKPVETDPFLTTIVVNHLVPSTRHVIIKDDGQTVIDEWLDSNENVELPPDSTVHIRWVYVTSD